MKNIILGILTLVLLVSSCKACDDVDTQLCIDLGQQYSELCNDTCLSSICRRSCGLCPAHCFECHEIDAPKNCSNLVKCPSLDHYCFTTQSFTDHFKEIYKLGCATEAVCKQYFGDRVGRGLRIDATCCATDKCNNMTPEEIENAKHHQTELQVPSTGHINHVNVPVPKLMDTCDNIDDAICTKLLTAMPGICLNDSCVVSKLCPHMCGKCFKCYNCYDIDNIDECRSNTSCITGKQQCFSLETLSIDLRPVYRLGCFDEKLCDQFSVAPLNSFGKRQDLRLKGGCCHTDMCNHAIHLTSTTTTKPTTRPPACTSHHAGTCPADWQLYHSSCYHIGEIAMSWNESKSYCSSKCGKLADFNVLHSISATLTHLHGSNNDSTQLIGQRYWSDAFFNNHRHWIWSTSGSRIDSVISHSSPFRTHGSLICGAVSELRPGKAVFLQLRCNETYQPLCELL